MSVVLVGSGLVFPPPSATRMGSRAVWIAPEVCLDCNKPGRTNGHVDSDREPGTITSIAARRKQSSVELADHPTPSIMQPACKHPKVRVVAREEDVDYVECLECGEVFDADEYQEMTQDTAEQDRAAEAEGDEA